MLLLRVIISYADGSEAGRWKRILKFETAHRAFFLYSDYRQLDKNCEAIRCLNYICSQIYIPNENKEQRDYALKAVWNIAGYISANVCACFAHFDIWELKHYRGGNVP